jgi:hypothetical protein
MKKLLFVFIAIFVYCFQSNAQVVMPPDSTDKNNNSAESRRKGLHTNGDTESDKRNTWSNGKKTSPGSGTPKSTNKQTVKSKPAATRVKTTKEVSKPDTTVH